MEVLYEIDTIAINVPGKRGWIKESVIIKKLNGRKSMTVLPVGLGTVYELPKNGVVDLVSGMILFVRTPQAKLLTLDVNPSDTVQDVKRKIQNLEWIPVEFQRLNYNQQPLTDDTKTLSGYKIKSNNTLDLADANPIYITTPMGRTITMDVDPHNPILQLKEALQDLEGIPAAQQKIFFAGKPLMNGRSLLDYRVPKGATLDMNPTVTEVTVIAMTGSDGSQVYAQFPESDPKVDWPSSPSFPPSPSPFTLTHTLTLTLTLILNQGGGDLGR